MHIHELIGRIEVSVGWRSSRRVDGWVGTEPIWPPSKALSSLGLGNASDFKQQQTTTIKKNQRLDSAGQKRKTKSYRAEHQWHPREATIQFLYPTESINIVYSTRG